MKHHEPALTQSNIKKRILPIIVAMTLVCLYQLYWLAAQYDDIDSRLHEDIHEALRSSDFEELAHRVGEIDRMKYQGRVDVNVGYDNKTKSSFVESEISESPAVHNEPYGQGGNRTVVSPSSFGSVLKNPEDLVKIGLNMQRGIHSGIDGIIKIDMRYLDSILTVKLLELGLDGDHQLLYMQKKRENDGTTLTADTDTIESLGNPDIRSEEPYRLDVSDDSEYVMKIPGRRYAVLKKMLPAITFSAFTLMLLILTFRYLLNTMRRQRLLDELKTDFTNNITHELKTPIAVAYAANDSLLNFDTVNNTPRINRYLKVCQEQLRLLDSLVEQILSMSMKRDSSVILETEEIRLRDLIHSLADNFSIRNSHITITVDVDDNLTLMSDRMHLSNIINNLIDNAIKYSGSNNAAVKITAHRCGRKQTVIEVSDNGIGISDEHQKFIFDKFYRVPHGNIHDVKGYGLGLFYVRNMTTVLGGSVEVRSEYGKGSRFILKFN